VAHFKHACPDARSSGPQAGLWDIDHTLIETRGVGRAIYERAFHAATGRPLRKLAKIAGRTELDIMRETLRLNDIEPGEVAMRALVDALIQGYENARDELASTGRALPGAHDTLRMFDADPLLHQAVLSGNLRAVLYHESSWKYSVSTSTSTSPAAPTATITMTGLRWSPSRSDE
jgi:beta-phosphoglucomutase-like phosphatase (HAD superfamily)